MFLRFFVFRHGETDWNLQKKFQGHSDIELNQKGHEQAQALQRKFADIKIKHILSSDLVRAKKTAEIAFAGREITWSITSGLRETHLGRAEGMTHLEINEKFGENFVEQWRSIAPEHQDFAFPGGETKSSHLVRLRQVLESYAHAEIHRENDGIAVSTHGGCLVRLVHACVNAPEEVVAIPNCALYELKYSLLTRSWFFEGEVNG